MITTTNKCRTRHSWQRHSPNRPATTPPLEPGDRLSRAEFERRYVAMPHVKKAELIEGVVYMPSPSEGRYTLLSADKQGHIQSRVFPDLHLNVAALLTDDLAAVLQPARQPCNLQNNTCRPLSELPMGVFHFS